MRLLIVLVLSLLSLAACETAPVTGRSQLMLVSESEERSMGALAYRQVMAKEQPTHDANARGLVERIGRRIAAAAEAPPETMWKAPHYHWEFTAIERSVPNAFCLPGGKVAVYTGLLPITQTEAGLAAVIGHEVAHALARHSAERLSDQRATTLAVTAVGVALAVNRNTSAYSQMTIAALGAGATVGVLLPMSRKQESEADRIGLILMALAGYDPHEAIGLWERMRDATARSGGSRQAQWLSTHPSDEQRIVDIRSWVPEAMKYYRRRD